MKKTLLPKIYDILGYDVISGAKEFLDNLVNYQRTGSLDKFVALEGDNGEIAELERIMCNLESHTHYCESIKKCWIKHWKAH